tara:strand:- start:444 stop:692 length:249 start_codon:yes stop_codon:yes gene_type:complete
MISLKEFLDLEEASVSDVYQDHLKVMKDLAGGNSTKNLEALERTVNKSKSPLLKRKFKEFKKAHLKAKQAGQFFTRAIEISR